MSLVTKCFSLLCRPLCPILGNIIEEISRRRKHSKGEQHESQRSRKVSPDGKVWEVNLKGLQALSHKNEKGERL